MTLDRLTGNINVRRAYGRLSRWLGIFGPLMGIALNPEISLGIDALPFANNIENELTSVAVAGNGTFVWLTVPEDEIWQITWAWYALGGGTFNIAFVQITDPAGNGTFIAADDIATTAGKVIGDGAAMPDTWLYPGEGMGAVIDGHSVNGTALLRLRVRKYNIVDGI